jgi:hypothetical protein
MALLDYDDDDPAGDGPPFDAEAVALANLATAVLLKALTDLTSTWSPTPIRGSAAAFFDPASPMLTFWCGVAGVRVAVVLGALDRCRRDGHVVRTPYRQVAGTGRPVRPARPDEATA